MKHVAAEPAPPLSTLRAVTLNLKFLVELFTLTHTNSMLWALSVLFDSHLTLYRMVVCKV